MSDVAVMLAVGLLFVGQLWLIVRAFQQSVVWGLACLFVPFADLAFVVLHWDEAANPFLVILAGFGCLGYSFLAHAAT